MTYFLNFLQVCFYISKISLRKLAVCDPPHSQMEFECSFQWGHWGQGLKKVVTYWNRKKKNKWLYRETPDGCNETKKNKNKEYQHVANKMSAQVLEVCLLNPHSHERGAKRGAWCSSLSIFLHCAAADFVLSGWSKLISRETVTVSIYRRAAFSA